MEMRAYLGILRRRWWLLVLGPALAVLTAVYVTGRITPMYRSSSQVLVVNQTTAQQDVINYSQAQLQAINEQNARLGLAPLPPQNVTEMANLAGLNALEVNERLTNTYVNLITRRPIFEAVLTTLGLTNLSVDDLARKVAVTPVEQTQLISISATDADPALAAAIANAMAQTFVADVTQQLGKNGAVMVSELAAPAREPYTPKLAMNVAIAVFMSLMLAGGLIAALEYLDDTVKTAEDIEPLGLTSLGMISRFRGGRRGRSEPLEASDFNSATAESYRQLRTNIRFTSLGSGLKTIVVTSAGPGEGKSTTASNLAAVLAQAGDRVILVDADLRRSSLRKTFESPTSFGLTGLLYNDIHDPSVALVNTRWKNLRLLPAGVLPPNPSELLTSARMQRVIEALRGMADYVIFDTPPVLAVTDAIVLAARTDGTLVVAEAHRTRNEALRETVKLLQQANARIAGIVLNRVKRRPEDYYYYREELPEDLVEVEADIRKEIAPAAKPAAVAHQPAPADLTSGGKPLQPSAQDLLRRHVGGSATPIAAPANGNGKHLATAGAVPAALMETAALADMLSRMDETMGLIRSLRPNANREEPRGL